MSPDAFAPGSPADWLRHAKSDLAVARQLLGGDVLPAALCFHAQQAAEKALKAVLVYHDVQFPYTHSIARLITLVVEIGLPWPQELDSASELSEYAVALRYPGPSALLTETDCQVAADVASRVVNWVEEILSRE